MAYTINLTNGTVLTTIADGTVNTTSTDLTLVGKNYAGYGQFLNTNIVHLLENFNSTSEPTNKLTGQLWWDSGNNYLKVYTGSSWKSLSTTTSSSSQPSNGVLGNSWWDTLNEQLYIYNGTTWTLIGPAFSSNTGTSGTIVGTIVDSLAVSHVAVNVYVSNDLMTIISADDAYTPQTAIPGFTTIKPGFNLVSTAVVPNVAFYGTASDASRLGNVSSASYARTDVAETFDSTVKINNNSGLTVGTSNNFTTSVSGSTIQLTNNVSNADIVVRANVGGALTTAMTVIGSNATVNFASAIRSAGNARVSGYVLAVNGEDATSNVTGAVRVSGGIGMTGNLYSSAGAVIEGNITAANFIGNAVKALYSDLAERYLADAVYEPGTVVILGGEREITLCNEEESTEVFGVVSTDPAYLMNSSAGDNAQPAPAIAMMGRVPVKVIGPVAKGQRLVSTVNGCAKAATAEVNPLTVIGRSLEDKLNDAQGVVEVVVRINI